MMCGKLLRIPFLASKQEEMGKEGGGKKRKGSDDEKLMETYKSISQA